MNSPVAAAMPSFDAATMPPFSARRTTLMRWSSAAAASRTSTTCGEVEQSSTRQSSHSVNV
jgi:hypothetical protein